MSARASKTYRLYQVIASVVLLCVAVTSQAQERVVVAVIEDGPSDRMAQQQQIYVDELLALVRGEFDIDIRRMSCLLYTSDAADDDYTV